MGVAALLAVLLVATGTSFVGMRESVGDVLGARDGGERQSGAQISAAEFEAAYVGMASETLRGLVGQPEATSTNRIEGLRIECWYYGVGGGVGAYQLCFANGKLQTKLRYAR